MNKKITVGLFCMMMVSSFCKTNAQTYQTFNVTSGYNADLIANGSGTAASSSTESVDSPTNGFVFMSTDFVNGSGVSPASGLPSTGLVNSVNTSGLSFQLASYSSNNALKLSNTNDSGTLSFGSNPKASALYMLATTGNGSAVASVVVNFTDGTNQTFTNQSVSDWYGGSSFAIKGIGRASRVTDAVENNVNDPRLYEISMVISSANQSKNIANVSVTKTSSGTGYLCVFGFSYKVAGACIAPDNITASNVTTNSATISWISTLGSTSYELYKSTSNTAPTGSTAPTDLGITGTSTNITGLTPATPYYVWVRGNCGGGSTSEWSLVSADFTTLCASVNTPYVEDFNSNTTSDIPMCTSTQSLTATGGAWSVADATTGIAGFSSYVVYTTTTDENDANTWFYTKAINLQAGTTYTLSFDYGNYVGSESFKVAYGTSAVDTSMTNIIQDFPSVTSGSSATATFTITPTTTGVYYFGFNVYTPAVTGQYGVFILDNISVTSSSLSTVDNQLSSGLQVYPNPTSDYLYLKNTQKVTGMKVFDVSGKIILSSDKAADKIDVSQLIKGAYFLVVKNLDGTSTTHKFIKK